LLSRAKDSQRFPKRCGEPRIYFAISLRSVNSIACGSMAASLFFYFYLVDEVQSRFYKIEQWALKTVAAAAGCF